MNSGNVSARFTCVQKGSDHLCIDAIAANEADMRTVDAGDVYSGWKEHGLKVKRGSNGQNFKLFKQCHADRADE